MKIEAIKINITDLDLECRLTYITEQDVLLLDLGMLI